MDITVLEQQPASVLTTPVDDMSDILGDADEDDELGLIPAPQV